MRDLWYEVCERRDASPAVLEFNKRIDSIQQQQLAQGKLLQEIKTHVSRFYASQAKNAKSSISFRDLSAATGITMIRDEPPGKDYVYLSDGKAIRLPTGVRKVERKRK